MALLDTAPDDSAKKLLSALHYDVNNEKAKKALAEIAARGERARTAAEDIRAVLAGGELDRAEEDLQAISAYRSSVPVYDEIVRCLKISRNVVQARALWEQKDERGARLAGDRR